MKKFLQKISENKSNIFSLLAVCVSMVGIAAGVLMLIMNFLHSQRNSCASSSKVDRPFIEPKTVLYISSYDASYEYVTVQLKTLSEYFSRNNVRMESEFMDSRRFMNPEFLEIFYLTLKYKFLNGAKYDAMIIADDFALEFYEAYKDDIFKGLPVVFLGINNLERAKKAAENPWVTGITEIFELKSIVNQALQFYPSAKNLIALVDSSIVGKDSQKKFEELKETFPDFKYIKINSSELTRAELAQELEWILPDSIFICIGGSSDADGNTYTVSDLLRFVSSHVTVPVFTPIIYTVGKGFTGGVVNDIVADCNWVACRIMEILRGKNVADIPLEERGNSNFVFDYNMMRRYGLNPSLLPKNAIILNQPDSYFSRYKSLIVPFFLILCSMLLLMIILIKYATSLRTTKNLLSFELTHNPLTKLPNRRLADQHLRACFSERKKFSVLSIDIEEFKNINNYYSRDFGNMILREVAMRLSSMSDVCVCEVYRYTSDEFTLIVEEVHIDLNSMEFFYLRQLLSAPFGPPENPIFLKTCIGIANSEAEINTPEYYLSNADIAMYEAKRLGHNKTVVFTPEMRKSIQKQQEIVKDVEYACEYDGFYVLFQPQVDAKTGRIYGYEALSRLHIVRDGIDKYISPLEFIPVAEKSGFINKMARIVTEKIIKHMAEWKQHGIPLHKVSINFSAAQMSDKDYLAYLKELLDEYRIEPSLICLEITESLFLGNKKQALELFEEFKKIGITLALDDFGTGYSSLSYLAYLPVEIVKLDKTLIDTYLADGEKELFIKNIVDLVHSLDMRITVEGVEEQWQLDKIRRFGGDVIQGYYYSKPIPANEVENYIP